jgi:putative ABC transport system ATP-binding protein
MNKQKVIIKVKNVYKSFSTGSRYTPVLKDVTMDISEGEFLIIYGPSGCGKSTLLHAIMGLERPDRGEVDLYGIGISKMNTDDIANIRKRDMGIMYQQQNWIKALNVKENLALSAQLLGFDKEISLEKAKKVLQLVDMEYREEYIPSELSAGEQQKIGIARALITNPKILIADEPTGNLDVKSGFTIAGLLKDLSKKGITVIMVTHNPDYLNYADRVIFMVDGKLYREVDTQKENIEEIEQDIRKNLQNIIDEKTVGYNEKRLKRNKLGKKNTKFIKKIFGKKFYIPFILIYDSCLKS